MTGVTFATSRRRVPARLAGMARPTAVLILLLAATAITLLYVGRHLTFNADEWVWAEIRRSGGIGTYLEPYNNHFSLFPMAVYRLFFALFGLRHYTPYRAADVALHLLCATLLYVLVRRRLGAWLALVPTALLLFMGTAAQDLLWGFQIGFLGSVAGGLGALVLIEDRRSDALAAALLTWAIASSGVGLSFLLACFVLLVARRDPWRRLWIVGVPALVFVIWYLGWGNSEPITLPALLNAPGFVADAAAAVGAGIAGLGTAFGAAPVNPWGPAIAVGALIACSISWRRRGAGAPTPMLLAAGAGALSFWVFAALERSGPNQPGVSRYLYIGAVFVWLAVSEVGLGTRLSPAWLALAGLLAAGALIGNLSFLRTSEVGLRELSDYVRASLTATEIAAPVVRSDFIPYPLHAPEIHAGQYLSAVPDLGSPAFTVPELGRTPFAVDQRADQALVAGERLVARTGASSCRPAPLGGPVQIAPGQTIELRNAGARAVKINLRRFASGFTPPSFAELRPGASKSISFPMDRAPSLPWHLEAVPANRVSACVAAG